MVPKIFVGLVSVFLAACAAICISGLTDDPHAADLAVVFGNKVDPGGRPSPMLEVRLNHTIELFREGYFGKILVSGGIGKEGYNEPDVMKSYLVSFGIPPSAIIEDVDGADTFHTARNTKKILRQHGWHSVLLISQYFHIARCRLAMKRFQIQPVFTSHAPFFSWRDLYSIPREVVGYIFYDLRGT